MKKLIFVSILLVVCGNAFSGQVGLPKEKIALPIVQGSHLVCIWDHAAGNWLTGFESYNHAGVYDFQVPKWGMWYWIGLWDKTAGEYVAGKWIGHFVTE